MNKMIKADIYFDGEYYCGKCIDFDIFTQGKTLDELAKNLKEAIKLHFEDFFSIEEIAKRVGVSQSYVYRIIEKKQLRNY